MSYIPGKPTWFEINSPDADATKRFYGEVLGWKTTDMPMGEGNTYTMFQAEGSDPQCGIAPPQGDRAHWVSYVSVEDVDAAVATAKATGGKVVFEPMTIPTVGRFAGVADPEGAVLLPFRAETGDSPDSDPAPGRFYWLELMADDPATAAQWFQKVFGWDEIEGMKMADGSDYHIFKANGVGRAGAMGKPAPGIPSHWLPYVNVADVDAALERARKNGGTVNFPAFDAPGVGRIGHLVDPQGAALGIITPAAK